MASKETANTHHESIIMEVADSPAADPRKSTRKSPWKVMDDDCTELCEFPVGQSDTVTVSSQDSLLSGSGSKNNEHGRKAQKSSICKICQEVFLNKVLHSLHSVIDCARNRRKKKQNSKETELRMRCGAMGDAPGGGGGSGLLRLGGQYDCLDVFSKLSKMDRLEAVAELIRGLNIDESIVFVNLMDGRLTDRRIHSAVVSGINVETKNVPMEWFETDETKGKEAMATDQEERNGTFSPTQLEIFELAYNQWPYPFPNVVNQLAQETGIKPELVVEWFWKKTAAKVEQCINNLSKDTNTDTDQSMTKDHITPSMHSKARAPKADFNMNTTRSKQRLPEDALKLLASSFKLDPECPGGGKLDFLEAETGMTRVAIKRWFSNRRWRLANRNNALAMECDQSDTKSKKVPSTKKGTKSSSKRDQRHWIQDPTLPQNWSCCNINGSLMFKSPEGHKYSSRMDVIKSFHSQGTGSKSSPGLHT